MTTTHGSHRSFSLRLMRLGSALLLIGALVFTTGCFGRFPVSKATYRLNDRVSENEFYQTVTMWFLLGTMYPYAFIVDLLVLNPIQFWSGESLQLGSRFSRAPEGERGRAGYARVWREDPGPGEEPGLEAMPALAIQDESGPRRTAEPRPSPI